MPDPVPSVPDELVEVAARALDEWPWRTGSLTISTGMLARAVLEAVSEAGWVRAERLAIVKAQRDEARAQAEALREDGRKFADWLERDRREPDKVLCVVQSMRRAYRESQEPDHAA